MRFCKKSDALIMRHCKKSLALIAIFLSLSLLGGCGSNGNINKLAFLMGVAVDAGEQENEYRVTAQVANPGVFQTASGGASSGDEKAFVNFTATGVGMELPFETLKWEMERLLYSGHNQLLVMSKEVAEAGVTSILDFFLRSANGRFTLTLFIAEGEAKELLEIDSALELFPATYLKNLVASKLRIDRNPEGTIVAFLSDMLNGTTAPMLPTAGVFEDDEGNKRIELTGMAVFKGDAICTYLDESQARAVLLIKDRDDGSVFHIDAFDSFVSLKTINSRVEMTPVFSGDELERIVVDLELGCSVSDTGADTDILAEEIRNEIAAAAEDSITERLSSTLEFSKEYSADVFEFGDMLYRRHPRQTRELLANWEEEYQKLTVDFHVTVDILNVGAILHPLGPYAGLESNQTKEEGLHGEE